MVIGFAAVAFVVGALVSLGTSWVLVSRLERVGERLGVSEALLGLLAALAADTPEITAAVTALTHHQLAVGSGVVIGSNAFNLAALLGLGAVVAGRIDLHRKVVALGGAVALWVAVVCLVSVLGVVDPVFGLGLVLVVLVPYVGVLAAHGKDFRRLPIPRQWVTWLAAAVAEEEVELADAIRPERGRPRDAFEAAGALVVVVAASVTMERGASALGTHYAVAGIVLGGLVLAAVTSLPNGVAALSTALHSNALNVALGLLLPAAFIGLAKPSGEDTLVAAWYVGLTALTLTLAYKGRGLRRWAGWVIIVGYAAFAVSLLVAS